MQQVLLFAPTLRKKKHNAASKGHGNPYTQGANLPTITVAH